MTKQAKVEIRCSEEEKLRWREAAGGQRAFGSWARTVLNQASTREDAPVSISETMVPERKIVEEAKVTLRPAGAKCARWMHHRPGVYCGTCQKVS